MAIAEKLYYNKAMKQDGRQVFIPAFEIRNEEGKKMRNEE